MFKRYLQNSINKFYDSEPNLLITGSRQAGKTTLLSKLVPEDLKKTLYYITFDDPDTRLELSSNAYNKLNEIDSDILVLDEIQKMPGIMDSVKQLIDTNRSRHHYLTGSAQVLMLKSIQESLAGRIGIWSLYPLSLFETLGTDRKPFLDLFIESGKKAIEDYVTPSIKRLQHIKKNILISSRWGGFPVVWSLDSDDERYRWLSNYKRTYLDKDIRELSGRTDILSLAKFINILSERSGNILSLSDAARDTGVSVTTAGNYIRLLELSYQVHLLKPYYENSTKRFIKSPKIYFLDNGLLRVISGNYHKTTLSGKEYETWIFSELIKWISAKAVPPEIFYYRTSGGMEIDFLLKYKELLYPIEVKNRERIHKSDISGIKRFKNEYGNRCGPGIIVYPGSEIIYFDTDIYAVPDRVFLV